MQADMHCITLFQHLSNNMCVFMGMDHFNAGARKGCSKLGIFKFIIMRDALIEGLLEAIEFI